MPLSQEEIVKYKALYLKTARQYIQEMQENLSYLQSGKTSEEALVTLHRAAHSLKGQSQFMAYTPLSEVSRLLELLFFGIKEEKRELGEADLIKIVHIVSAMGESLDAIEKNNQETDLQEAIDSLKTLCASFNLTQTL